MSAVPLDRPLLDALADEIEYGPHVHHARVRRIALAALTKAYEAGYRATSKSVALDQKKTSEANPA